MLKQFVSLNGRKREALLGDCGYITGMDLATAHAERVELFGPWNIATEPMPRTVKAVPCVRAAPRAPKAVDLFAAVNTSR